MDLKQKELINEVEFNGQKITKAKLQEEIELAKQTKGMKIIEVRPGVYKTRIQG